MTERRVAKYGLVMRDVLNERVEDLERKRDKYTDLEMAERYVKAAKIRLEIDDLGKAIKDYRNAAKCYSQSIKTFSTSRNKPRRERYSSLQRDCERNADRLQKVRRGKWHGLEGTAAAAAVIGFIGGIFFLLDSSITGNAIGNLSDASQNGMGIALFALGLIGAFIYTSKKR